MKHKKDIKSNISLMLEEEDTMIHSSNYPETPPKSPQEFLNNLWREKVTQWYYDVVDNLGESRDIVYTSMHMLDRYCVLQSFGRSSKNEKEYELAAMTALFLSLRLCGSNRVGPSDIMRMSRRGIEVQDIVTMGKSMVKSLSPKHGKHRLVTPMMFVRSFLSLLPSSVNNASKRALLESATYLVEVSVYDSFFSAVSPSKVAYAAILNGMDGADNGHRTTDSDQVNLRQEIFDVTGVHHTASDIQSLRARLHRTYSRSAEDQVSRRQEPHVIPEAESESSCNKSIPARAVDLRRMVSSDNLQNKNNKRSFNHTSSPQVIHDEETPNRGIKKIRRLSS